MRSGFSAVATHERYAGSRPRGSQQSGKTPTRPLPAFAFGSTVAAIMAARLGGIGRKRIALAKAANARHGRAALLKRVEATIGRASFGAVMRAPGAVSAGAGGGEGQSGK